MVMTLWLQWAHLACRADIVAWERVHSHKDLHCLLQEPAKPLLVLWIQASSEEVSSQIPVISPHPVSRILGDRILLYSFDRAKAVTFIVLEASGSFLANNSQEENIPHLVLEFVLKTCDFWEQHDEPIKVIMFNHELFGSDLNFLI